MNEPLLATVEVKIARLCECLSNWENHEHSRQRDIDDQQLQELASALTKHPELLHSILSSLQLRELADVGRFFEFISGASDLIGYDSGRSVLLGMLWAEVFVSACEETRQKLLDGLLTDRSFFSPLCCVPSFVERVSMPTDQMEQWLVQIRVRLGNDGASGGFWGGIFALAVHHPVQSLELLGRWTSHRPSPQIAEMAARLLGRLRAVFPAMVEEIDIQLQIHPDEVRRIIFHQSWTLYDNFCAIESAQYKALVEQMTQGTPAEIDEAFNFVCSSLSASHRSDIAFEFGCLWLHGQIQSGHGKKSAYVIIQLAIHCDERTAKLRLPHFRDLLPLFCPIPKERQEVWYSLQRLLIGLLNVDCDVFKQLLFLLACADPRGLIDHFSSHGSFGELTSMISRHGAKELITDALSSLDEQSRLLGIALFRSTHVDFLSSDKNTGWNDEWVAVLIYQVQLSSSFDVADTRFLCALLPRVHSGCDALKEFFVEELVWQMKSLPGSAFSTVKVLAEKSSDELLDKAVGAVQLYIDNLSRSGQSAINSMQVGGYRLARRVKSRKWSKQISDETNRNPLIGSFSKSFTLYGGKQWQTYFGAGGLHPPQLMSEFSHRMEFPRLPTIDPDGFARRQRRASHHMRGLVEQEMHRREESAK